MIALIITGLVCGCLLAAVLVALDKYLESKRGGDNGSRS